MNHALRFLFFVAVVRPLLLVVMGLNVRRRELLPGHGPAVIVANHNSHLDVLALMTLFPLRMLPEIRPVAASDYFLRNRLLAWFSLNIMGIIPIERQCKGVHHDPLEGVVAAIQRGNVVIVFPEGSRGEPEHMGEFKNGVAHLARRCPDVPIHPVFLHGLGKTLPRGEALLVPFFCDVFIGEPLVWESGRDAFMSKLESRIKGLAEEGHFATWE